MTPVGDPERVTQNRVIDLFVRELGYRYLDDWSDREGNSNVEDAILTAWLRRRGHSDTQVARALDLLHREVRNPKASGETIDLKAYEADMRHLIDTYIDAEQPRKISPFDDMPLLELIVKTGIAAAVNSLPDGIKRSKDAVAETIANNVRSRIIKDHLNDATSETARA